MRQHEFTLCFCVCPYYWRVHQGYPKERNERRDYLARKRIFNVIPANGSENFIISGWFLLSRGLVALPHSMTDDDSVECILSRSLSELWWKSETFSYPYRWQNITSIISVILAFSRHFSLSGSILHTLLSLHLLPFLFIIYPSFLLPLCLCGIIALLSFTIGNRLETPARQMENFSINQPQIAPFDK